jgi:hypothetical protein
MSEATKKLDKLIAELPRMSKRLNFHEKCAAYFALDRGFRQSMVAKVFGVSSGAVSALANCRNFRGGSRYQDVREEYDRLGREAFGDAYFTDEIATKFQRFRLGVETDEDRTQMHGPDTRPGKWGDKPFTFEAYGNRFITCIVQLRMKGDVDPRSDQEAPQGWSWRELSELERDAGRALDHPQTCPPWSFQRWATPARAVDGCYEGNGVDSQRLHPEWPDIK